MNNAETLLGVVVDVCTRSFLLVSDQGTDKRVLCDTLEEFTNVLNFVRDQLPEDQIDYAEVAMTKK